MKKTWLGYLGSALIFVAGIMMLIAKRYSSAILLILVAIAGSIIKYKMSKKQ